MPKSASPVFENISQCRICAPRFLRASTCHEPRPVFQGHSSARILIAGQAPGARVHASGRPFTDPSGDRLRRWMGIDETVFYEPAHIAILPMAFCFPGYDKNGADLPPPVICARTWRAEVLGQFPALKLTLLVGGYAQKWHLQSKASVSAVVSHWQDYAPQNIPLPHPSWRNNAWLKKNKWFETDMLPYLQARVKEVLDAS